jgi:capsule polysaccharide export protein KpsC/LpsZ
VSAAEIERQNRTGGIGAFVGIARWKRKRIRQFFTGSPDAPFCNSVAAAVAHIEKTASSPAIAIWPSRTDAAMLATIPPHIEIYRIEDGFIRSTKAVFIMIRARQVIWKLYFQRGSLMTKS